MKCLLGTPFSKKEVGVDHVHLRYHIMIRGTGFFCHFKSLLFKHELPECNLFVRLAFGHYDVLRCCAGVGCRQAAAALLPEHGAGAAAPALSRAAAQAAHAHLTAHAGILCWK